MATIDISRYTNPRYIQSDGTILSIGTLVSPSNFILISGTNILSWSASDTNATNYEIAEVIGDTKTNIGYSAGALTFSLQNIAIGSHTYVVRALDNSDIENVDYSPWSAELIVTITKISAPNILYNAGSSEFFWSSVTYAEYYDVYVNDKLVETLTSAPTSATPYVLYKTDEGIYNIMVYARNSNTFLYQTSDVGIPYINNTPASGIYSYTVAKLSQVYPTLSFNTENEPVISWSTYQDAANATSYDIYLNGVINTTVESTVHTFISIVEGISYSAYIIAKHLSSLSHPNPMYISSIVPSNYDWITFGKLARPVLSITDNAIKISSYEIDSSGNVTTTLIDGVPNAEYYEIYNSGVLITTTTDIYYLLSSIYATSFNITVRALINSTTTTDSDMSNNIVYFVSKLIKPTISYDSQTYLLSWSQISNADYYEIYINSILKSSTALLNINIKNLLPLGISTIFVIAISYASSYLSSDNSNYIRTDTKSNEIYKCTINNDEYYMDLPFTIKETLDESMDTGNVILHPNDISEPFEAYTPISIHISDTDGKNIQTYDMLIEEDNVSEVQVGYGSKYRHTLTLIELTKLLETEIMPDLAITQPLAYIQRKYSDQGNIVPTLGTTTINGVVYQNNFWVRAETGDIHNTNVIITNGILGGPDYEYFQNIASGIHKELESNIEFQYYVGDTIPLPRESGPGVWDCNIVRNDYRAMDSYTVRNLEKLYPNRKWYMIPHDDTKTDQQVYESTDLSVLTPIASTTTSENMYYKLINSGVYDMIFTIDGYNPENISSVTPVNLMEAGSHSSTIQKISDIHLVPYKVLWRNIKVSNTEDAPETYLSTLNGVYTIEKALDKIISAVSPRKYLSNDLDNTKYALSNGNWRNFKDTICPDTTFENSKSLYECLLSIGRLFSGIPRLKLNDIGTSQYVIDFDILSELSKNKNIIENTNELQNVDSSMENHSSGFISNISNMVSSSYCSVYPNSNFFTTPRSGNESDPYVTRSNMAIVVDKPIFKLIAVEITNYSKSSPTSTMFIEDYIYEKTVFDTMNNNEEGKGTALYWNIGKNQILGLGIIPEAPEMYAAMGWAEDKYVIQNILEKKKCPKADQNDVNAMQYKVWYIPYTSTKVYTEQSNLSNMKIQTYKVLNQDDNTISDEKFGASAQRQIERLGNNSIQKTYRYNFNINKHFIGEIKLLNDEKYYADVVVTTFNNNYIENTVSYSKNFNKVDPMIGVDAAYRQYEIYDSNFIYRDININNYCYLSQISYDYDNDMLNDYLNLSNIRSDMLASFYTYDTILNKFISKPKEKLSMFYCTVLKDDANTKLEYTDYDGATQSISYGIAINASYNIYKNSFQYSGQFLDNFSAGISACNKYNGKYIQKDVRYVDDKGRVPTIKVNLCYPTMNEIKNDAEYDKTDITAAYPIVKYYSTDVGLDRSYFALKLKVDKDNREALRFNYQMHFLTYDKHLNIHDGMMKYLYRNNYLYKEDTINSVDEFGEPVYHQESPIYIGYNGTIKSLSYASLDSNNIFGTPVWTVDAYGKLKINSFTAETATPWDGYALIWPHTKEIIYDYEKKIYSGTVTIPALYFNISENKISYRKS